MGKSPWYSSYRRMVGPLRIVGFDGEGKIFLPCRQWKSSFVKPLA
jgi:hypothetical protein